MSKILVVDDEPRSVKLLRLRLEEAGHHLLGAGSVAEAKAQLSNELLDLLITDVRLPDGSGLDIVSEAKAVQPHLPVVVITAHGAIQDAVDAMRRGAAEYVLKPFEIEQMALLSERLLESARIRAEHSYLLEESREREETIHIVGQSAAIEHVRQLVRKVSASRSNVLLLGESGTGKELVAQAIHFGSTSRKQPLIRVNCPGIPAQLFESELFGHMKGAFTGAHEARKGKFELAGKGNILLDEVSEIPVQLQAKLLRVIEERRFTRIGGSAEVEVEARIIAATNRDLKAMVRDGKFREDLYYRLNVFPIELPPLRERREDIPETAHHLLHRVAAHCGVAAHGIEDDAMDALVAYDWPGNVRELRNILERALVLAQQPIGPEHLPMEIQDSRAAAMSGDASFQSRVDRYKRDLLVEALRATGWSKKDAASRLGITQRAFSHYVGKYDLDSFR